jgi:hypothetical protein
MKAHVRRRFRPGSGLKAGLEEVLESTCQSTRYLFTWLCTTGESRLTRCHQPRITTTVSYQKKKKRRSVIQYSSTIMQQPNATLASTIIETHPGNENTTSSSNIEVDKATNAVLTDLDPEPPFSTYTHTQKKLIVLTISFIGLLSPLSASIYFPAINTLAHDLHVSTSDINLTVTSYLVSCCLVKSRIKTLILYPRSSKLLVPHSLATYPTSKAEGLLTSAVLLCRS